MIAKMACIIGLRSALFCILLLSDALLESSGQNEEDFLYDTFPQDFQWGLATSSYQIEGGWDADGKGENIWDYWSHENNGSNINDGGNGDIACDSYNQYGEDVRLLKNMGVHYYRFSISWARIIPTGKVIDGINTKGIEYYDNLINALLTEGIQPVITIYHWDLPMGLQNDGGWLKSTIVDHYADYARTLFRLFASKVHMWLTFNEPWLFCLQKWNYFIHGDFEEPPEKPYICSHNMIKAHAKAWHIYDAEFRPFYQGKVGITLIGQWGEPKNSSDPEHVEAADRWMHFKFGWWANPLRYGEYPRVMREFIDKKSEIEGRQESRLPVFDETWANYINGTMDFIGVNHYSTHLVVPVNNANESAGFIAGDAEIREERDPSWNSTGIGWAIVPWGIRKMVTWISNQYQLPVYVTENGYGGSPDEYLNDQGRVEYYRSYINEVLKAIKYDGADVKAYTGWSLLDNYEWAQGYTARFGIHWVNFTDPRRPRFAKASAISLHEIFKNNGFPNQTHVK